MGDELLCWILEQEGSESAGAVGVGIYRVFEKGQAEEETMTWRYLGMEGLSQQGQEAPT